MKMGALGFLMMCTMASLPADAAGWRDPLIDKPRPVIEVNSLGSTHGILAGMGISIQRLQNLPEGRRVRLTGKVENRQGNRLFILRDATGKVEVVADQPLSPDVKEGFEVTVAGRIRRGLFGTDIKATSVRARPSVQDVVVSKPSTRKVRLASTD